MIVLWLGYLVVAVETIVTAAVVYYGCKRIIEEDERDKLNYTA